MAGLTHDIPELDRKGLRDFGLTTGGIIAVLFGLFFPWVFERALPWWPWAVFAVLGTWGLVAPLSLRPVYRGWMKVGLILNKFMTPLIMSLVFYLVITPVSVIKRLFGKDAMARKFSDADSYRVPSEPPKPENLKRPY